MNNENNKMQVDIENLFKQNVNDLSSIKELYRKLKEVEEKILQIKYIDSNLANKLKKEYENLKKLILDENIQAKLNNDIETINSQLDTIDSKKTTLEDVFKRARINVSNKVQSNPVATFIVDDGTTDFLGLIKPIFDSYSIKGSIGIITELVGTSGYMTIEQLKKLQAQGYSMLSHTATHDAKLYKNNTATASDNEILNDLIKSYNWMCENGFNGADTIVYPWGEFSDSGRYKNLSRTVYNNGVNAGGTYNQDLNDNMYLNRSFINKSRPIEAYKQIINNCKNDKGWVIFGIHAKTNEIDETQLRGIIEYLLSENFTILPFIEANEIKGNAINIGDYTMGEKFFVSKTGKVLMTNNKNVLSKQSFSVSGSTEYPSNMSNISKVSNVIIGNIKLQSDTQKGTFTNGKTLCVIENLTIPNQIITNCIVTANSKIYQGAVVLESDSNGTTIKCFGSLELSNIRWININFSTIG